VSQFDSAGRCIRFDASPTSLEIEAAHEIEALTAALSNIIQAWRAGDVVAGHEAIGAGETLLAKYHVGMSHNDAG
jgi:hypothetical protein